MIYIRDVAGANAMVFLRLDDDRYFGGITRDTFKDIVPRAYGPHMTMGLGAILDMIGQFALLGSGWSICGDGGELPISRVMNGQILASILGCTLKQIREHYERIVVVAAPAAERNGGANETRSQN